MERFGPRTKLGIGNRKSVNFACETGIGSIGSDQFGWLPERWEGVGVAEGEAEGVKRARRGNFIGKFYPITFRVDRRQGDR